MTSYTPQLKNRLKIIGAGAFYMCSSLSDIELPDGLEEIGCGAFRASGLKSITTPLSVRIIQQSAFCECENLKKAVLNEGLEELGMN